MNVEELKERMLRPPRAKYLKREMGGEEDGWWLPIPTNLYIAVTLGEFTNYERQVLLFLTFRAYCKKKVMPWVTLAEIAHALKKDRSNIQKTLKKFQKVGVIVVQEHHKNSVTYQIQSDVRKWKAWSVDTTKGKQEDVVNLTPSCGMGAPQHVVKSTPHSCKEEDRRSKKKEKEEEKESPGALPQTPGASPLPPPLSLSENPNQAENPEAEEPFIQEESPIQRDVSRCTPLFWEDQKKVLQERKEKKQLSSSGSSRRDGPWTDEQLRADYGPDTDCQKVREMFRGAGSQKELLNLQTRFLRSPELIPRLGRQEG